jgi:four helix bundle protein
MDSDEMKGRTKAFALDVLKLGSMLPNTSEGRIVRNQLVRSATSVGANYGAACRARSKAEFIAKKLGTVEEEADESAFWLEIINEGGLPASAQAESMHREAEELTAIVAASRKTAKSSP